MRRFCIVFSLGLVVALVGCGSSDPMQPTLPPPPPTNPDPPSEEERFELTIVGWQNLYVDQGDRATLQVRYTRNGVGLANESINFAFTGDSRDSTLEMYTVRTNASGIAEAVFQAGQMVGDLGVEARSPQGNRAQWTIVVEQRQTDPPKVGIFTGTFKVDSKFRIETPFEGTKVAEVLSLLNEMSNDPDDPGKFVVDRVLEKVTNSAVIAVANFLRPTLNKEVNKLIVSAAPEMVNNLKTLAQNITAINRRFDIVSHATAPAAQEADRTMRVNHVLKQIAWELNGRRAEYSFAQLGMAEPTVENLTLTALPADQAGLVRHRIQKHTFDLKWGSFMLVALNELIIPGIDSEANSIGDLLAGWIECENVGKTMNDTVNLGGESLWSGACDSAMKVLAGYVEERITDLNADTTTLTLEGETRLADQNGDVHFDLMAEGTWKGDFTFGNATADILPESNTFTGTRVH